MAHDRWSDPVNVDYALANFDRLQAIEKTARAVAQVEDEARISGWSARRERAWSDLRVALAQTPPTEREGATP